MFFLTSKLTMKGLGLLCRPHIRFTHEIRGTKGFFVPTNLPNKDLPNVGKHARDGPYHLEMGVITPVIHL